MTEDELKLRTKQFALRVIKLVNSLSRNHSGKVLGNQLLRSGTSVGANYRAACRARSAADFLSKLGVVEEESDESLYWMELMTDSGLVDKNKMNSIMQEANELTSIFAASIRTLKQKSYKSKIQNPKSQI